MLIEGKEGKKGEGGGEKERETGFSGTNFSTEISVADSFPLVFQFICQQQKKGRESWRERERERERKRENCFRSSDYKISTRDLGRGEVERASRKQSP